MTDTQIIDLYWARSEEAILATADTYGGYCAAIAWNILHSREDTEECVNDTWHRAWDTMPPQRPNSLRAYLCRIVRNLSIDRWRAARSQKRGEGLGQLVLELEDCVPAGPSAEEAWEARETAAAVDRWLDALAQTDRMLFVRRYWYGERVDQLAARFGYTPNGAAQRLRRLRDGLRRALEQEGVKL